MGDSPLNIGSFLDKYGGGGRQNVGAVICSNRADFAKIAEETMETLSRIVRQPPEEPIRLVG